MSAARDGITVTTTISKIIALTILLTNILKIPKQKRFI